jgi:hypothetical protein
MDDATRRSGGALVLSGGIGLAAGGVVLAMFRARFPSGWYDRAWINALALGVSGGALWLSIAHHRARRLGKPLSARIEVAIASALGLLSVIVWTNLGNVQYPFHRWEQFTYYVGAKYFPELGYSRIYRCTAVAEARLLGPALVRGRTIRDLSTDEVVSAATALDDPNDCKQHFSPARWTDFFLDVNFFRRASGSSYWAQMQTDHGFNPPPAWIVTGGALASLAPASTGTQTLLACIDPILLGATFAMIAWAFGARVLWVAIVVWGCQLPDSGAWTIGAFLRQDWLLALIASVCLARRGWWIMAGVGLATSAALRIFPVLLLGLPALIAANHWLRRGSLARAHRHFALGLLLGGIGWLVVSSSIYGFDSWRAFARHLAAHREASLANHVGLRAILSQTISGRLEVSEDPGTIDAFRRWREQRKAAFAARRPLYVALAAAAVLLLVAASRRIRVLWCAIAASALVVVVSVDLASYYYAFFIIVALLAAVSPVEEWLALGAVVLSRLVNTPSILESNSDIRYTLQSYVFLAWAVAALAVLAWSRHPRCASAE